MIFVEATALLRRERQDQAITANAKAAITQFFGRITAHLWQRGCAAIHEDEVIPQALIFPKRTCQNALAT